MQKLYLELKNVPEDVHHKSSALQVNVKQRANAAGLERSGESAVMNCLQTQELEYNNVDVIQRNVSSGQGNIFVLDKNGSPVMPTSPGKARRLIRDGVAKKIWKRGIFGIQLLTQCRGTTQPCKMGIDPGYGNMGISVISDKKEFVSQIVHFDNKVSDRLKVRSMYRRGRRNKHHWYREPRFNNRRGKYQRGWLPPSTLRRYEKHLSWIKFYQTIYPIKEVWVEKNSFDIQKIDNPDIVGEQYQQGSLYKTNLRNYLYSRQGGNCALCNKTLTGSRSEIHHIQFQREGGSDRTDNLVLLHDECHHKYHKDNDKLHQKEIYRFKNKKSESYKDATNMNIIKGRLIDNIPDCNITYGYITSYNRKKYHIEKDHNNDAFVIAGGIYQERTEKIDTYEIQRHNRCLQSQTIKKLEKTSEKKEKFVKSKLNEIYKSIDSKILTNFVKTYTYSKNKVVDLTCLNNLLPYKNQIKYSTDKEILQKRDIKNERGRYRYKAHDLILVEGKWLECKGMQNKGERIKLEGSRTEKSSKVTNVIHHPCGYYHKNEKLDQIK